jgi:fido (protein-threonine AMPylation protein)
MIVYEISNTEDHPVYQELQISNTERQYSFLLSIIKASIDLERPFLSTQVMKALNFHAITCLHTHAGEYRPCMVKVGEYEPPMQHSVSALMDDFVNYVNFVWKDTDLTVLAAFVLWRLNHIHPFINGNGRTARAICYFVICAKLKNFLPGTSILPELLLRERNEYVDCLKKVDQSLIAGELDLEPLALLIQRLLNEQIATAPVEIIS